MGRVTVFVDDAVLGELPPVCVQTGRPAEVHLPVVVPVGHLGPLWLLVLFGPIGWILLAVAYGTGAGRERVTVRLPHDEVTLRRHLRWRRLSTASAVVLIAALAMLVTLQAMFNVLMGVAAIAVALWVVAQTRGWIDSIGVELDGSRRWVTLSGVHPHFVTAVTAARQEQRWP